MVNCLPVMESGGSFKGKSEEKSVTSDALMTPALLTVESDYHCSVRSGGQGLFNIILGQMSLRVNFMFSSVNVLHPGLPAGKNGCCRLLGD